MTSTRKMGNHTFYKGVPKGIHEFIYKILPTGSFEVYDEDKHKSILKPAKPVRVRMPRNNLHFMCALPILRRLKYVYPLSKFEILSGNQALNPLIKYSIENYETFDSLRNHPQKYAEQIEFQIKKTAAEFGGATLMVHTLENSYKNFLGLRENHESTKEPTIFEVEKKDHIAIIPNGSTFGGAWDEMRDHLKQTRSGDGYKWIDTLDKVDDLISAKFCISCGNSDWAAIAAYFGVPVFAFFNNPNKNILLYQLMLFNNVKPHSMTYAQPAFDKPLPEVSEKIFDFIGKVTTGQPIDENQRDKIEVLNGGT